MVWFFIALRLFYFGVTLWVLWLDYLVAFGFGDGGISLLHCLPFGSCVWFVNVLHGTDGPLFGEFLFPKLL
jgi:bacteriorhodopsin